MAENALALLRGAEPQPGIAELLSQRHTGSHTGGGVDRFDSALNAAFGGRDEAGGPSGGYGARKGGRSGTQTRQAEPDGARRLDDLSQRKEYGVRSYKELYARIDGQAGKAAGRKGGATAESARPRKAMKEPGEAADSAALWCAAAVPAGHADEAKDQAGIGRDGVAAIESGAERTRPSDARMGRRESGEAERPAHGREVAGLPADAGSEGKATVRPDGVLEATGEIPEGPPRTESINGGLMAAVIESVELRRPDAARSGPIAMTASASALAERLLSESGEPRIGAVGADSAPTVSAEAAGEAKAVKPEPPAPVGEAYLGQPAQAGSAAAGAEAEAKAAGPTQAAGAADKPTEVGGAAQSFAAPAPKGESGAAAVREATFQAPVDRRELMAGVIGQIKMSMLPGKTEMDMVLRPESLGRLALKIVSENGAILARFTVESDKVRETLEANMQGLRDALERQGIVVQGLTVSVREDGAESGKGRPWGADPEWSADGRGGAPASAKAGNAEALGRPGYGDDGYTVNILA